jgi:hypothetical protein
VLQFFFGVSTCVAKLDTMRRNKTDVKMVVTMSLGFDGINATTDKSYQLLMADFNQLFKKHYNRPE